MTKTILLSILILICNVVYGQNLFLTKVGNCVTSRFCLDCGDTKVMVDKKKFKALVDILNSSNNLKGLKGGITFQILVDSTGVGCVLSHSDVSDNKITKNIIETLNSFDGFTPAKTKDKIEARSSFNMLFEVSDGRITAKVQRVDIAAFKKGFDKPKAPEIYNTNYVYDNENLKNYQITVWNSNNSNLPNNMNDDITIDRNGFIWLTIEDGLVKFDGKKFHREEQDITDKGNYFAYSAIATDNKNIKWVYGKGNIYSYDNKQWKVYDSKETGTSWVHAIVNDQKTSEVLFASENGVIINKDGKWTSVTKEKLSDLPSNRIAFSKRDSKNRLWIGTFKGSAMIDEVGKIVNFENTETVLKGQCIWSMDEDEDGNLYFALFEFNPKVKTQVNRNDGIAICDKDGSIKRFTTDNSGMPFNNVNCLLYNRKEKVLWLSTDRAGLVRYDLKGGWENYNSDNSDIPTSYISQMAFDNDGVLYLATRQGLVRIAKK